jgi:hypothetical protein
MSSIIGLFSNLLPIAPVNHPFDNGQLLVA